MEIDKKILSEIREYCSLNNIKDVRGVVNTCLKDGFNIMRYGSSPFKRNDGILKPSDSISGVTPVTMKVDEETPSEGKIKDNSGASVKKPRRVKIIKN